MPLAIQLHLILKHFVSVFSHFKGVLILLQLHVTAFYDEISFYVHIGYEGLEKYYCQQTFFSLIINHFFIIDHFYEYL